MPWPGRHPYVLVATSSGIVHGRDLRPPHRARRCLLGDSRPGAINLLLGTADATTNSTQWWPSRRRSGSTHLQGVHQSVDLVSMFAPVTKWAALCTPGGGPRMVRKRQLAQTTPGRLLRARDIEECSTGRADPLTQHPRLTALASQVRRGGVLDGARPIVLAGHGAPEAPRPPATLLQQLGIRSPPFTQGCVPDDHHTHWVRWGHEPRLLNFGFDEADVIVSVAMSCRSSTRAVNRAGTTNLHLSRFRTEDATMTSRWRSSDLTGRSTHWPPQTRRSEWERAREDPPATRDELARGAATTAFPVSQRLGVRHSCRLTLGHRLAERGGEDVDAGYIHYEPNLPDLMAVHYGLLLAGAIGASWPRPTDECSRSGRWAFLMTPRRSRRPCANTFR